MVASGGLAVRLVGLATALLCADDLDHGKLRLGNQALATTLSDTNKSSELVVVLTHHPLTEGWLADQREAAGWLSDVHNIPEGASFAEHPLPPIRRGP